MISHACRYVSAENKDNVPSASWCATPGLFFGHSEKNSSPKKLKTQANSHENSSKISEKLKNRQLNLSFYNIKVAFSFQKCAAG